MHNNSAKLTINSDGYLGIGTDFLGATMVEVSGEIEDTDGLRIWAGRGPDRTAGKCLAWGNRDIGVLESSKKWDFYADTGDYGPFAGGHEVKLTDDFPADIESGVIVSVTGQTQIRYDDSGGVQISSTLPTVKLSDTANDKAVFRIFVAEGPLHADHWYEASETERFATVNALGEGRVWVCNINGEIEAGEYITTSTVPGYGQRQDDDLVHSYTLGKAIETIDWGSVTEIVDFDGQTYKAYIIAVVYTSG